MPAFAAWQEARDAAKKRVKARADQRRNGARDEPSDPAYQEFRKLCVHGTTMSTPKGALSKAQARKLLGEPSAAAERDRRTPRPAEPPSGPADPPARNPALAGG